VTGSSWSGIPGDNSGRIRDEEAADGDVEGYLDVSRANARTLLRGFEVFLESGTPFRDTGVADSRGEREDLRTFLLNDLPVRTPQERNAAG
jgi:hypothetical protein